MARAPLTKGPGLLLRQYTPSPLVSTSHDTSLEFPGANITSITTLASTDDKVTTGSPSHCAIYEVLHISKLLNDDANTKYLAESKESTSLDWQVYRLVSKRSRAGFEEKDNGVVASGATIVCVGVTPKLDSFEDYSKWFEEEHAELLSKVPGWVKSSRYELAKSYGSQGHVAPFIAVHLYDELNGLGGPEWKKSVETEWTLRVREQCAVPHFRRVWIVKEQKKLL
jgi:hypothetical protein